MARLSYFLLAQYVSVDQSTNAVSAFGVIEEVRTSELPILIPSLTMISTWVREDGDEGQDFQCIARVTLPGDEAQEVAANFQLTSARHRVFHRFEGIPIQREGQIRVEVLLNGRAHFEYLVPVVADTSPSASQPVHIPLQVRDSPSA